VDIDEARAVALQAAATILSNANNRIRMRPEHTAYDVIDLARELTVGYLYGPGTVKLVTTAHLVRPNWDDVNRKNEGTNMALEIAANVDDTQLVLTIQTEDDKGDVTPDQLSWSTDDTNGNLVTPSLSADTKTQTLTLLGKEGVVNITASDPSSPNLAPSVITLTIGAGATSQLVVGAELTHADGTTSDVGDAAPVQTDGSAPASS
jgi:hypothetical protein